MGYQSVPYVVSLFSAMLWLYYALLKQTFLLITINSLGIVIESIYIFIYILYAAKEAKVYIILSSSFYFILIKIFWLINELINTYNNVVQKQTTKLVAIMNVGIFSAIFLITYFAFHHDHGVRISVVGWICVGFAVSVFASPLSIVVINWFNLKAN